MKGKLTPRESFILYGVWIMAAFALFMLGLYWGKGQATGLTQEITTQPIGSVQPAIPRPLVENRLGLANREASPPVGEQQTAEPLSSPPADGSAVTGVKPPAATSSQGNAAPPLKPPASVSSSAKEAFSIQVAALKTEEEARKVITRLQTRGYTGILDEPASPKDFYRVRVGNYASREDAARAEALLKQAGFLTFVKKVSEPSGR